MRIVHRYLGFFLAGIMIVYSVSGIVLVYRDTDIFKVGKQVEKKLQPKLKVAELARAIRNKNLKINNTEGTIMYFKNGTYNSETGLVNYTSNELPFVLKKMAGLHKATTKSPVYWLNIFFGVSLLFFAVSTFWMFLPKTKTFRNGLYYTIGGIVLTLILLFV